MSEPLNKGVNDIKFGRLFIHRKSQEKLNIAVHLLHFLVKLVFCIPNVNVNVNCVSKFPTRNVLVIHY